MELVEGSCGRGCSGADAGGASCARTNAMPKASELAKTRRNVIAGERIRRFGNRRSLSRLEPESRLITHWRTIKHVTRRRRDPVSFGTVFDSANERRAQIAGRDRIGKTPLRIRQGSRRRDHRDAILSRDLHGLGGLVNLQGNHRGADEQRRDRGRVGSQAGNIEPEQEVLRALERDAPDRFLQELVPLPAMEFVQEIIEVTWRRLLIFLEPQKLADLFFVQWVHAAGVWESFLGN